MIQWMEEHLPYLLKKFFLCPELWKEPVVVMDNLPAHKLASIVPMIEAIGASVICLSPYSRLL
jgi:putative transposase